MSVQDYLIMKTCIFFLSLKENQQDEEVDFEACVVKYVGWFVCLFFEGGGQGMYFRGKQVSKSCLTRNLFPNICFLLHRANL